MSPQPNIFDFNFLAPCPTSGLVIHGNQDQLVTAESMKGLKSKLTNQKKIAVDFVEVKGADHFFLNKDKELIKSLDTYIKKESRFF